MKRLISKIIKKMESSLLFPIKRKRVMNILSKIDYRVLKESNLGEKEFVELQSKYRIRDGYKYDKYCNWERGFLRAKEIIGINISFKERTLKILDLCCGDGMTGKILEEYGHRVIQHDINDWRDLRAKPLQFFKEDLANSLKLPDQEFDVIYSFNSFEHIPNPPQTLLDITNHLKKGGYLFLKFGPLYHSPWGLHAYRTIYIPYVQFLFKEEFIKNKLAVLGIRDLGQKLNHLQPLNKWGFQQFENMWDESGLSLIKKELGTDFNHINLIKEFPHSFQNRGLNIIELCTQSIGIILQKNA